MRRRRSAVAVAVALAAVLVAACGEPTPLDPGPRLDGPITLTVGGAYLVQSVQRLDGTIPLITGRQALLRVFLVADRANSHRPSVRATLYQDGQPVRTFTLETAFDGVPTSVREQRLDYRVLVPEELIRPGAGLVVEADPDRRIPTTSSSVFRWPSEGVHPLTVRDVPPFRIRIVPVRLTSHNTTPDVGPATATALRNAVRDRFPMDVVEVDIREPISSGARLDTQDGWTELLTTLRALRDQDGSDRTYYGVFARPTGALSTGRAIGHVPVAVGVHDDPMVGAHEIGHTLSLSHAPCGTAGDPAYPHASGAIGHYGYNTRTGELFEPDTPDLMSYCFPRWLGDYHYLKVLAFRDGGGGS